MHLHVIVAILPFQHLFHINSTKFKKIGICIVEVGKKCQVILHFLGILHHQAIGHDINNNVK
jgi:hypothetical protein